MGSPEPLPVLVYRQDQGSALLSKILSVVAVLAVLSAGFLGYSNWKYSGRLAEQRALVTSYIAEAKQANADAARAELAAEGLKKIANEQAELGKKNAARAHAAEVKLAASSTTQDSLTNALEAKDSWHRAYRSQLEATAKLQQSYDLLHDGLQKVGDASAKLQGASTDLVNATKPSFWKRLAPHASINVTAGVNPQGKPDVVAGVGLGWNL